MSGHKTCRNKPCRRKVYLDGLCETHFNRTINRHKHFIEPKKLPKSFRNPRAT